MDYLEATKALSEPVKCLIKAVEGAIGKAYEPVHIKRMADAHAYEIEKVGNALRSNADLPICYEKSDTVSIDTSSYEDLIKRTGYRLAYQEIERQSNIECIINGTYEILKDDYSVVEGEVTREWMNRFINAAGDISSDDLKKIWSKVLAGEVKEPSTFSLRTLECLRNMSCEDAVMFKEVCKYAVDNKYIYNEDSFLRKHMDLYNKILKLDECGLINSSGMIQEINTIDNETKIFVNFGKYVLVAESDTETEISLKHFPFTAAGRELCKIIDEQMCMEDVKDISKNIINNNKQLSITLHRINGKYGNIIDYDDDPIEI